MVVIFVVDGQLPQTFSTKLPSAVCTDGREHFQRPITVAEFPFAAVAPGLADQLSQFIWIFGSVRTHRLDTISSSPLKILNPFG